MANLQAGYTPKPDLNNEPNLAPEDRAALEAFRAGLLDAVASTIVDTNIGATMIDDAFKDMGEPQH